ncbi:hypothetical protein L6164_003908 [Bauhinia variegata]|uniref:Uncharacterized protein n=1 Tax=Bauhinia variegata TaxID=167791 RepID=A0ACB9Q2R2_BAUVA|nr:hypothetical protein L6164_003908 [Bauhinia variegata]
MSMREGNEWSTYGCTMLVDKKVELYTQLPSVSFHNFSVPFVRIQFSNTISSHPSLGLSSNGEWTKGLIKRLILGTFRSCASGVPYCHFGNNASITVNFVYYYCPRALEERESLTANDSRATSLTAGFLVGLNLEASIPDTFQPPPTPLPYDVVLGCPASTDSESGRETVSGSSFETLITCEDLEESECKAQVNFLPVSPRKLELSKSNECHVLVTEEEDVCPICLEEYDVENPKTLTKCEHHFHLSCILEWMERSDSCPICDKEMIFDQSLN